MRAIALSPRSARLLFAFWVHTALAKGWCSQPFSSLEGALDAVGFGGLKVTRSGRLILPRSVRSGLGAEAARAWAATFGSPQFRDVEQEHLVVVSLEQLAASHRHRNDVPRTLEFLLAWLSQPERRARVVEALKTGIIAVRVEVREKESRLRPRGALRLLAFRDIAGVAVEDARFRTIEGPDLDLSVLWERSGPALAEYEHWVRGAGVRHYSLALGQALMTGVPLILIAFAVEHALRQAGGGIPWALKLSEFVFRFLSGYTLTVLAWFFLERRFGMLCRSRPASAPEHAEVVVFRGAVLASLLGPMAMAAASLAGLGETSPAYSIVAITNSSSDNLTAAAVQAYLHLALLTRGMRRPSPTRSPLLHPFVVAYLLGVVSVGALDFAARLIAESNQTGVFSQLGLITVEATTLGVGDSLMAYVFLQLFERRAFSRVKKWGQ